MVTPFSCCSVSYGKPCLPWPGLSMKEEMFLVKSWSQHMVFSSLNKCYFKLYSRLCENLRAKQHLNVRRGDIFAHKFYIGMAPNQRVLIYRWPGFLAIVWFGSSPTPSPLPSSRCLSFSLFLCVAGWAYWRGRGLGRSQIIWWQEGMLLNKLFNTLSAKLNKFKMLLLFVPRTL